MESAHGPRQPMSHMMYRWYAMLASLMSHEEVSGRSFDAGTPHVYQNLKKSCYHGIALLLFDGLIFHVKRDGFWCDE